MSRIELRCPAVSVVYAGRLLVLLAFSTALSSCALPLTRSRPSTASADPGSGVSTVSYDEPASGDEDEDEAFALEDLAPHRVLQSAKSAAGLGPDPNLARQLYADAEVLYQQAVQLRSQTAESEATDLFDKAADQFAAAAKRWPESALEQDALFRVGECRFFTNQLPEANEAYESLLKKHPNTKYVDLVEARRFAIAEYWLKYHDQDPQTFFTLNVADPTRPLNDAYGHAIRILGKIPIEDPTGKLADDAILAAANAEFRRGKYLEADRLYSDLRTTFPSSEHQFVAHFLGVKTKLLSYQGPQYSGDPLDDAEKLIKQIHRQFPVESSENSETLARAYREVRYKKAEREWSMASYYDRRREYGAANFYYDVLITDYSDTPFAERAQERREKIAGRPLTPPQRLAWLVRLFPSHDAAQPLLRSTPVRR